jgi:hypothetical protein
MNSGKVKLANALLWLLCVAACALAGAAGVGFIRGYGAKLFPQPQPAAANAAAAPQADKWLDAVRNGDERKALADANAIVPESLEIGMPKEKDLALISELRVRLGFLTAQFNSADFIRWRDLVELKELAGSLLGSAATPEPLLRAVAERVKRPGKEAKPEPPGISVLDCWRKSEGSPEEALRLLCGLAAQAGYEAEILGLFSEPGKVSYQLCLLRKGQRQWLADPITGAFWETRTGKLDLSPLAPMFRPESQGLLNGPFVHFIPAEPQDFRQAEQLLYARLQASGAKGLPQFPLPLEECLRRALEAAPLGDICLPWTFPFAALRSLKGNPGGWLLDSPGNSVRQTKSK